MLAIVRIGERGVWWSSGRFGLRVIGEMTPLGAELALEAG